MEGPANASLLNSSIKHQRERNAYFEAMTGVCFAKTHESLHSIKFKLLPHLFTSLYNHSYS